MLCVTWLRGRGGGGVNCGCEICRSGKALPLYICGGELWASSGGEKVSMHLYPGDILQGVVFCDFAKAYDRVRWEWLWKVLDHVGLGGGFSDMVKACYWGAKGVLALEGMTMGVPCRICSSHCLWRLCIAASARGVELPRDPVSYTHLTLRRRG